MAPYSAANRSAVAAVRFQTVSSKSARARLAAMREPMIPAQERDALAHPQMIALSRTRRRPASRSAAARRRRAPRSTWRQLLAVEQVPPGRAGFSTGCPGGRWRRRSVISE